MNRHFLQIFSCIFCFICACLLPTSVFGAHYYQRINLSENLISSETLKMTGLPENLRMRRENHEYQNLSDQDLSYMLFLEANLQYAMMMNSDLTGAQLIGANLRGAFLENANLTDADLTNADLREADLRGANLRRAKLSGANLSCARLDDNTIYSADELAKCNTTDMRFGFFLFPSSGIKKGPDLNDISNIPGDSPKLGIGKCSLSKAAGEAYRKLLRNSSESNLSSGSSEISPSPTNSPKGKRGSPRIQKKGSNLMITPSLFSLKKVEKESEASEEISFSQRSARAAGMRDVTQD